MRQVGRSKARPPAAVPSAEAFRLAAVHQATGQALAALPTTGIRKGIYRFASHAEMNRHTDEALAHAIALNVRRLKTKRTPRDKDRLDREILERALSELKKSK